MYVQKKAIDILMITLGAFIFALAVNVFVIPNDLGEGGVTGVTIILYYLYGWSPGLLSFILNGILLIIGYKFLSKQTIRYTIVAIILMSLFLHFTRNWTIEDRKSVV